MPPVRTSRRSTQASAKSPYETPMCKILVGEEEALFKINEGLLRSTSFFAKGPPRRQRPRTRARSPEPSQRRRSRLSPNADGMFFPDGSDRTIDSDDDDSPTIDLTNDDADFILKGRFYYTRDAFSILVRSLNDAPPLKPKDQDDCRSLFKAYALAQEYDAALLQNQVIDALQSFYAENTIPITDVIYLVKHWGDGIDCFLAAYLVAQAAYEMAVDWDKYRLENEEMMALLSGTTFIVEQLLQSLAQYARASEKHDPAKQKRNWRFGNV